MQLMIQKAIDTDMMSGNKIRMLIFLFFIDTLDLVVLHWFYSLGGAIVSDCTHLLLALLFGGFDVHHNSDAIICFRKRY